MMRGLFSERYAFATVVLALVAGSAQAQQPPAFGREAMRREMEAFNKQPDTPSTGKYPALKEEASPYFGRIDPKQIAVSGWSCGGLQALQIAVDPRVRTVIIHRSSELFRGPALWTLPGRCVEGGEQAAVKAFRPKRKPRTTSVVRGLDRDQKSRLIP